MKPWRQAEEIKIKKKKKKKRGKIVGEQRKQEKV